MFKQFFYKNRKQITAVFSLFFVAGFILKIGTFDLQTNLIAQPKVKPFNGTTTPLMKVPDWAALTKAEWSANYDQIPASKLIDFPKYDLSQLKAPRPKLDGKNKALTNAIITFSVCYLCNYKLDGGDGGHPAIDIKTPSGTPVSVIANGEVVKTSLQENGFGHHIVVKHDNVPSFNDANTLTTYYSRYSHLSDVLVTEGQIVEKGQLIAKTGQTGTATTPHLHFQIDNNDAPWHPYWHFTSQEAAKAGYDFTSAINAGFNKDKALKTTIDPMLYVQKYAQGYQNPPSNVSSSTSDPNKINNELPPTVKDTQTSKGNSSNTSAVNPELPPTNHNSADSQSNTSSETPQLKEFKIETSKTFKVNEEQKVKIIALDQNKKIILDFKPTGEVYINLENGSAILSNNYLKNVNFQQGVAEISFTPTAEFGVRISVSQGEIKSLSDFIQPQTFSETDPANSSTQATHQTDPSTSTHTIASNQLFTDISSSHSHYTALNFLKENEIIKGYADGSFQPEKVVSRVEALKFIYEGLKKPLKKNVALRFTDIDKKAWYVRYLMTAYNEGIVTGYKGNLFKPGNTVTKAEFLKMLFEAAQFNTSATEVAQKPFEDVNINDWHAKYVQYAKDKNLIDESSSKFNPNAGMSREEVAEILYRTIALIVNKTPSYSTTLVVSNDVFNKFFKN